MNLKLEILNENFSIRYMRLAESRSVTPVPTSQPSEPSTPQTLTSSSTNHEIPLSVIPSPTEMSSNSLSNFRSKVLRPRLLNIRSIPNLGMDLVRKLSPMGQRGNQSTGDDTAKSGAENPGIYEAESPDELALVNAARAYNVKLIKRTPRSAVVSLPDNSTLAFEVLHVCIT